MKKIASAWVLSWVLMIIPVMGLARNPGFWGEPLIDQGDFQVYRIHQDIESIRNALGEENRALKGRGRTRFKTLLAWPEDEFGTFTSWFTLGSPIYFRCSLDIAEEGNITVALNIKGPRRFREKLVFGPFHLTPGAVVFSTATPVLPYPGYYTFAFIIKSRRTDRIKGTISVID
jgi:hypothetical protein